MKKVIRTRYAPSPTGLFHVGGARTALFNYLFAKKNHGDFIVRIEDTDIERNVPNGIESQLNNLKWLKIFFDESIFNPGDYGPYIQSKKIDRYFDLAKRLLDEGKAYRCFCTQEKLAINREEALKKGNTPKYNKHCLHLSEKEIQNNLNNNIPFSLRLNIVENEIISWHDLIRGQISFPTYALTDPIIIKSNNYPTYNFAVVVDDYDMLISHVIRGEEHISNTPYQIAIKEALNFNSNIQYGHLSVIVDETGKKLSKRNFQLKQFIEDYKNMGFPPEAIDNFLYLLGLPPINNKEIFSIEEAIQSFDLNKISRSSAMFDFKKMEWISSEYFKNMTDTFYLSFVKQFILIDLSLFENKQDEILLIFKKQISYAKELNDLIKEYFITTKASEVILKNDCFLDEQIWPFGEMLLDKFSSLENWNLEELSKLIEGIKNETKRKGKDLFMPIRLFTTHLNHGPEILKIIFLIGKQKVIANINILLKAHTKNK